VPTRQALSLLTHTPSPFCFSHSYVGSNFLPQLAWTVIPMEPQVHNNMQGLLVEVQVCLIFRWASNHHLPDFCSQVAGVTDTSHHDQPLLYVFSLRWGPKQ
jgi:hypothetical protein